MRPTRFLTFLLAAVMASLSMITEAANEQGSVSNGTSVILQPGTGRDPNKRPNMPSRQVVECTYDSGVLYIEFTVAEGVCSLTLTEMSSGTVTHHIFDSSALTADIVVGHLEESLIEITTENEKTYSGILSSD